MKKTNGYGLLIGIVTSVLLGAAYVSALDSLAGIGIGILYGASFALLWRKRVGRRDDRAV